MDFRTFVNLLDSENELLWIRQEVDPDYELGALLQQAEARGKAICFEKVKGSRFPVVGGVMTSAERHALSIGRSPRQFARPGAWANAIAEARTNPLSAALNETGPAQEIVLSEQECRLSRLPVPRFFAADSHRFITAGIGIVKDPDTGTPNAGFYRAPIIDDTHFSVSAGPSSRLHQIYQQAKQRNQTLQIAYVIGAPPALLITAGCRIRRDESDFDIAGALQSMPMELASATTSDLLIPAHAEFVIEAEVDFGNYVDHTMGEFPDNYGETRSPAARITAITHRRDAVFHSILGGMNREHNVLGSYIFCGLREQLLEQLQAEFPGLRDIHVDLAPHRTGARCQVAVTMRKSASDEPHRLMSAIYSSTYDTFPLAAIVQRVVVTDLDVNILDADDIEWAIASRANTAASIKITEMPARGDGTAVRLAIDATLDEQNRSSSERPRIPGAANYSLDNYL